MSATVHFTVEVTKRSRYRIERGRMRSNREGKSFRRNGLEDPMTSPLESDRRTFLRQASVAAAVPAAATLLALNLPGTATAAPSAANPADTLPDYAPVPASALGPAVNESGYFVGRIRGNLYWVTDG